MPDDSDSAKRYRRDQNILLHDLEEMHQEGELVDRIVATFEEMPFPETREEWKKKVKVVLRIARDWCRLQHVPAEKHSEFAHRITSVVEDRLKHRPAR